MSSSVLVANVKIEKSYRYIKFISKSDKYNPILTV